MSALAPAAPSGASGTPGTPSRARLVRTARALVVPILVLILWRIAVARHWVNPLLLAPPERVITRAITEVQEGEVFSQLWASVRRDLLGFGLGTFLGILVGGLMGVSRLADRVLGPTFHAFKQVAIFAWIPLMSVWLGTGEPAKVVFIALAAFYPIVQSTYEGVRSVSREHIEVARVFRFTPLQLARRVILPGAAPSIFAGVHLALFYAWLATLGAEYLLAADAGIGNLMIDGREQFAMDKVLLGVIVAGAVGALLNTLANLIEQRTLRWRVRGL
ncbi:MAG: ABC transporter permease [Polyangiales bacterium]